MILGDNKGSPECRRVAFADLPKEGRLLAIGGKYSEVMMARGTQVVVGSEEETRRLRGAGRRGRGYIPAKSEMNQVFEHGSVRIERFQVVIESLRLDPQPLSPSAFPDHPVSLRRRASQIHSHLSSRPDHDVDNRISSQAMSDS